MSTTTLRRLPVLLLALAAVARADEQQAVRALDGMAAAEGPAYAAARKEALATPGLQADLDALLAKSTWTEATFPRLSMAVIAKAYLADAETVRHVYKLEGLDPAVYEQRRRADPECGRELRRLGVPAVGPMLEIYLKTFDAHPLVASAKQRAALREGIVVALAASSHPAAPIALRRIASSASELEGARKQALEGLGTLAGPGALVALARIHAEPGLSVGLRLAAIRGIAQLPSAEALTWLTKRLDGADQDERRAAVAAIGLYGSAWSWEARGPEWAGLGDELRVEATRALVERLPGLVQDGSDQLVEALATIAHPKAVPSLRQLRDDPQIEKPVRVLAGRALERVELALERAR
jgi:hypothetical protein